jgi:glycogen synthase
MRVVRLCSVFEPPPEVLTGRGVRFDPIGGMQNHTACLTRALDARGVIHDVVTTRPPGAPARQRLGDRATVHRVGLPVRPLRQLYSVPAAPLVASLARGATLVHAHVGEDLAVIPIALAAARRARIPLVLTIHCSLAHTLAGGGLRGAVLRHAGGRLERFGGRAADAVIALTPRLAALVVDDGVLAERVRVIPSGVVPADFEAPAGDALAGFGRPRVVFVGRLAAQKGVRHLLEAAASLRATGAVVCIVGDGRERPALQRLAGRLGIADRVHFLGFRPHDEIPGLLAGADVLVLPSVYEELGSVLLEGLQAGVPIVASEAGGIPDALGDAGVLVPPCDPHALGEAIDRLLHDSALQAALSLRARERARRYDWELLADRVLDVYRTVDGAAPARPREGAPAGVLA